MLQAGRPYYIIPLMVEQPTWGGSYIAREKGITDSSVSGKKIGQAFELSTDSWLTTNPSHLYAFASATSLSHPTYSHAEEKISLQSLIDQDPVGVLGTDAIERGWQEMRVLIKFTQAQNNSYQVHVQPGREFGSWLPKPESWYFLQRGKATLGVADIANIELYKKRCGDIDEMARKIGEKITRGELDVEKGKQELHDYINLDHPRRFVNTVVLEEGAVIDLSQGGTHHSWEMGPEIPEGNIVYEVQVNVMDEVCTLRSFDQGSIKSDGSVRTLTIDDYFRALDLQPEMNTPAFFLRTAVSHIDSQATVTTLFANQYYTSEEVTFTAAHQGATTQLNNSFQHIFAREGDIEVEVNKTRYELNQGWSLFLPAALREYRLYSNHQRPVRVIITHI